MNDGRLGRLRSRIVLSLIFALPLLYLEPRLLGISFPDAFLFPKRYLVEILSTLLLALCVADLALGGELLLPRPGTVPVLLFIGWNCATLFRAPSFHEGWKEALRWACYGMIYIAAADSLRGPARARALAFSALAPAAVVSLHSIAQYYGLDPSAFRGGGGSVYATLGNPNYVASLLAVSLPLAYWGWLCPGDGRRAAACGAVSLLGTAAILLTRARGGLAALLAGTIAGLLFSRARIARPRLVALALSAAAMALLLSLPSPLNRYDTLTVRKFAELSGAGQGGTAWRLMVWRIGLRMAARRPLAGSGPGSFKLLYLPRQAEFLAEPSHAAAASIAEGGIDFVHNDYLEVLIETGIAGLALFLWMLAAMVAPLRRSVPGDARPEWIRAGAWAGCVALLAEAAVAFPFRLWPSAAVFFALCGALEAGGGRGAALRLERRVERVAAGIAMGPVMLLSIGFISFSLLAELHYARGFGLFQDGKTGPASVELARAAGWQPHHGCARFFRGLCFSARGDYEAAIEEMRESRRTYARQALYLEQGRILGKLGRRAEALDELDLACAVLPRDPDAQAEKGVLLFEGGDPRGAADCFSRALALTPGSYSSTRNLAVCRDALGETDEALRLYLRAIDIGPADADLYLNAGAILARRGDTRRAKEFWEKALAMDPGNRKARANLERLAKNSRPAAGR